MALPVTITGLSLTVAPVGPFKSSGGNFYVFGRDATTATTIQAIKSTAPDTSWSSISTKTGFTTAILLITGYQQGDVVHLLVQDGTASTSTATKYVSFNMATDTFLTTVETVAAAQALTGSATGGWGCSLVVRSTGEVVAFYNGLQAKVSGTFRSHVYYRRRTGVNTWTTETQVDNPAAAADNTMPAAVLSSSDTVHFLNFTPTAGVVGVIQRTLSAANVLQTISALAPFSLFNAIPTIPVVSYNNSGTQKIVGVVRAGATGNTISAVRFDSGNTPTVSSAAITTAGLVPIGVFNDGTDVYAVRLNSTGSNLSVQKSTDNGATWGTATAIATTTGGLEALSRNGNVYERGGNLVFPFVVTDAGARKYNEYVVRALGATGTGTPAAQAAAVSGSGNVDSAASTGTGALAASASAVSGAGVSSSDGLGALLAQAAAVSGSGSVGDAAATGTGTAVADAAIVSGSGVSASVAIGALTAQAATAAGAGISASSGSGALAAQASAASGAGAVASAGSGALVAQAATASGSGAVTSVGAGALVAQASTVAGSGSSVLTGSGALQAASATVAGAGASISAGTGSLVAGSAAVAGTGTAAAGDSGALVAQAAAVEGLGVSGSVGIGALQAGAAAITGAGLGDSFGTGTLVAGPATVTGEGAVLEEAATLGTGALVSGAATVSGEGEVAGEVIVPPVYGGDWWPWRQQPVAVEGVGFAILPELEGEAHGLVVVSGASVASLPGIVGAGTGSVGVAGRSATRLTIKVAAVGDRGQAGSGSGVITLKGAATGRHDDDDAAMIALLLAA